MSSEIGHVDIMDQSRRRELRRAHDFCGILVNIRNLNPILNQEIDPNFMLKKKKHDSEGQGNTEEQAQMTRDKDSI